MRNIGAGGWAIRIGVAAIARYRFAASFLFHRIIERYQYFPLGVSSLALDMKCIMFNSLHKVVYII